MRRGENGTKTGKEQDIKTSIMMTVKLWNRNEREREKEGKREERQRDREERLRLLGQN